jgi:hypothetical protein
MALKDELRDPWGLLLGAFAGGMGAAVGIPVAAAAAIGAAVYGVKLAAGGLINRQRVRAPGEGPIRAHSPEADWVRRADQAVRTFQRLGAEAPSGPVKDRVASMGDQAARTLADVRNLAVQASSVAEALDHIDAQRLRGEHQRISQELQRTLDRDLQQEMKRSLDSVQGQLQVHQRLGQAWTKLMARMEAVVLGLEGLVTRLVEVVTMVEAESPVEGAQQIDPLAQELENLRAGLEETEDLSRRALSAYQSGGVEAEPMPEPGKVSPTQREGDRDVEAS